MNQRFVEGLFREFQTTDTLQRMLQQVCYTWMKNILKNVN